MRQESAVHIFLLNTLTDLLTQRALFSLCNKFLFNCKVQMVNKKSGGSKLYSREAVGTVVSSSSAGPDNELVVSLAAAAVHQQPCD